MNSEKTQGNTEQKSISTISGHKFGDFVFHGDDLFGSINQINPLETIIIDRNNSTNLIENEKYKFANLIQKKMTKNRGLKYMRKHHPMFFRYFLEKYKKPNNKKDICEIGSGDGVLLNNIVKKYKIPAIGIDAIHPEEKSSYIKYILDIRNFDNIPIENRDIISFYTLMYAPNSLFGIEKIFDKMSIGSEARLDLGPIDLYSKALVEYLKKNNKDNNVRLREEVIETKGDKEQRNLVIYLNKKNNNDLIHVPEKYIVIRGISYNTISGGDIGKYICNYYLENDPEFEHIVK